jgi:hypothetical protein
MDEEHAKRITSKSVDELLAYLASPEPGSPAHALALTALQVRIAEAQRDATREALRWGKVSALATAVATVVALIALALAVTLK